MKDQVDSLNQRNIAVAFLNSSLDAADKRRVAAGIYNHQYKLIFVAPERFAYEPFYDMLNKAGVGSFAIDEAHCISHWGHDFREDYRRLGQLKQRFPQAAVHAFTATATPNVRNDIVGQLGLTDPLILVGDFFRPNLVYSVHRRGDVFGDVHGAIRERHGQAGIVYCIRRDDVDDLSQRLKKVGVRAIGYHAGMGDDARTAAQDAFAAGEVDVVVATVAFGMGIDRSDIRFVIHAAMPKSIEHYQQETGRAGRDGKRADCILYYSPADRQLWETIIEKSEMTDLKNKLRMLEEMYRMCAGMVCRHKHLVSYFGQEWSRPGCGACDVCLDNVDLMPDSTVLAQKIMSAVARTGERFGAWHVADVLLGEATDKVMQHGHNDLSVFALLKDFRKFEIMTWIDQLSDQGMLDREGEYPILKIALAGWQVLRSQAEAKLVRVASGREPRRNKPSSVDSRRPKRPISRSAKHEGKPSFKTIAPVASQAPEPLDIQARRLYDRLRMVRREIAEENNVPAFMIFSDKTLREIARLAPTSEAQLLRIKGVGAAKCDAYGHRLLSELRSQINGQE